MKNELVEKKIRVSLILTIFFMIGSMIHVSALPSHADARKNRNSVQQQLQVSGRVTDSDNHPLPGVTVMINKTTTGTITDFDGNYTITVPNAGMAELVFSFVGFNSQTIQVSGRTEISVQLSEALINLDEVVVVGYGEISKRDLTGSVAKVAESEAVARQYNSVDALLQGRATGVQVSSNAGSPGGAISVRIRGTNSLRGNNEPLYVIDGIIINSAAEDVTNASTDSNELQTDQNGLTGLNPRDIESIEILKDASATAIYGSRGANGVVLITTKQGDKGHRTKINLYSSVEFNWTAKNIDVLDPIGFAKYQNERNEFEGSNLNYQISNDQVFSITYEGDVPLVGTTPLQLVNWQDEIYKLSVSHNEGVSISGSNNKTNYYFSAGYNDINGIVETTNIKKGDLRLNLSQQLSPKLKMDNRIAFMYQDGTFAQAGSKSGGARSFTKQVLLSKPIIGFDPNNSEELDLGISNPYAWLSDFDDLTKETRVTLSSSFEYEILKGLKYTLRGGLDYRNKERSRWYGSEVYVGNMNNGLANYSYLKRYSYTIDNLLMYNKKLDGGDRINATLGVTYDGSEVENKVYEVSDFPDKSLRGSSPQLGQLIQQPLALLNADEAIFSALGRINYSLKDRYIFTATFRADQSSKFTKENQWGYFPSAAFAWRANEEQFLKDLDIFYNLKFRLGWGQTGNQGISPYQTLASYATNYYTNAAGNTIIGNSPARIPNKELTWETTDQYNAGVDVSVFKGRLNATFDVYYKRTIDLLQEIELGPSNGFDKMTINRGTIENKGLELGIDGTLINKKDFSFDMGGRVAFNRGKVLELGLDPTPVWRNGVETHVVYYQGNGISSGQYLHFPVNAFMEGEALGLFWGYETNGIYLDEEAAIAGPTFQGTPNQAGDVIYVDHNGDGNISDADLTIVGDPNPDFSFGFDFNLNYKQFSLKVLFDGVYGNEIINGYNTQLAFPEAQANNILKDAYENAWRTEAPSDKYPRIGYRYSSAVFSDRIVEDGSYLRLNIVTLGYDLPLKSGKLFQNVNVYVSGRNLFYITNYSGYEPQVTSFLRDGTIMGVDWVGTPNVKSVLFGINVTF
ncbi:TonB-linked outer membrane protein, SusC/RagA family [Mariniphaga anaerophila]|uniref:TonB-linked outer membrane protein, SusC/RagA family n=1 Tax=Mariniphaga anaerophila TaxID=1484053 RepID=A0A1M4ZTD9_9BACT|nr:TonB-dependent receptor [Mariniphaga anaerophila]SHF21205.1 TonB-linked outer membrane protein, SusC/RagA family [Mariniphaga anaerophila]